MKVARRILKERILASGTIDPEAFQLRNGEDGVSLVCLELPCTKKRIQWVESKIKGEWRCYTADEIRRFGIEVEQGKNCHALAFYGSKYTQIPRSVANKILRSGEQCL